MIGERSGRVFQLAGRVRVTVARVDLETTKIDFTLAAPSAEDPPARTTYPEPLAAGSTRKAPRKPR
jgi:ribonuclease R